LAIGVGNIGAGLTVAFPISGSFSRSSENAFMDASSSMPNMITGLIIMFTLLFLTPLFYYLPQCALSANIIVAVLSMVDFAEPYYLWNSSKKEFCLWLLIFLVTLFESPETAIYVGLALCGALVLFNATRVKVAFTSESLVLVQLPGVEGVSDYVNTSTTEVTKPKPNALSGHDTFTVRVEGTLSYACCFSFQVHLVLCKSQKHVFNIQGRFD
jgi:MFS superfamily sulfate permease-like transporter